MSDGNKSAIVVDIELSIVGVIELVKSEPNAVMTPPGLRETDDSDVLTLLTDEVKVALFRATTPSTVMTAVPTLSVADSL